MPLNSLKLLRNIKFAFLVRDIILLDYIVW